MKIGIVIWDLTVSGGTQRQVIELANELSRRHEATVYCYAYNQAKCFPELTGGLHISSLADTIPPFPPHPKDKLRAFWYDSYRQFHLFDSEIRALSASIPGDLDVINLHDTFMDRVGYYYRQEHPSVRTVWMSNDSPAIFLIQDHQKNALTRRDPRARLQQWLYGIAAKQGRAYVHAMDEVVVLDRRNQRQVKELMGKDALIVRSGLDIAKFTPVEKQPTSTFQVLGTGILFRHRRFEDLIAAMDLLAKQDRKVHLNIIGKPTFDPTYATELTELTKRLELTEVVTFLGTVSEEELLRQYREADAFVFPNHNQTWGLAVFEAMASGTPVIVSKTAGAHEVLTDSENALLVDPLHPDQIAGVIARLMDSPKLGQALAVNGRSFVERNITWQTYAKNMERLFEGSELKESDQGRPSISVVVNTLNEEANIADCLTSVDELADEIIVVDMYSDDRTVEIAQEFNAKIFQHRRVGYVEPARNFAIHQATGDWILLLDADERVTPELTSEIKRIVQNPAANLYYVARKNLLMGRWVQNGMWWPDYQLRLWKRGLIDWPIELHAFPTLPEPAEHITAEPELAILHYAYNTIGEFIGMINRYSIYEVENLRKANYQFRRRHLILTPAREFNRRFFANKGYKDGFDGLVLAFLLMCYRGVAIIKYWEKYGQRDFHDKNKGLLRTVSRILIDK